MKLCIIDTITFKIYRSDDDLMRLFQCIDRGTDFSVVDIADYWINCATSEYVIEDKCGTRITLPVQFQVRIQTNNQ